MIFMWNLVESELLTVERLCGTLWNLVESELITVEPLFSSGQKKSWRGSRLSALLHR